MPLPLRPPTPLIQVSSPTPSEVRFKSPPYIFPPPTSPSSLNEFDPALLREYILRDAILKQQLRIDELSIICGEPKKNSAGKKSGVTLSIDLPSPITRTILGIPSPPPTETEPIGFQFFVVAIASVLVFIFMTYIYVKGFVSSH
nr:unnamed protein product [Haemonchus contortus]